MIPVISELEVRTPDDKVWPAFAIYIDYGVDPPLATVEPTPPPGSSVQRVRHELLGGADVSFSEVVCRI